MAAATSVFKKYNLVVFRSLRTLAAMVEAVGTYAATFLWTNANIAMTLARLMRIQNVASL